MLFLVFYFILFFVLIFQGTHVAGEVKSPLGTVPEEVGQASLASARWGLLLIGTGFLGLIIGLLGFHWTGLVALRHALHGPGPRRPGPLRLVGDLLGPQGRIHRQAHRHGRTRPPLNHQVNAKRRPGGPPFLWNGKKN